MLITVRYRPGTNASPKPTSPANVHKVFTAYWNLVATCCCAYPGLDGAPNDATTMKTSDRTTVSGRDRKVRMSHLQVWLKSLIRRPLFVDHVEAGWIG